MIQLCNVTLHQLLQKEDAAIYYPYMYKELIFGVKGQRHIMQNFVSQNSEPTEI